MDENDGLDGVEFVAALNEHAKRIDPQRLTCGVSWKPGRRNDVADLSGWNRYQGWYWNAYPGGPASFEWLDKMRADFPNRRLALTEYSAGGAVNHFDEHRRIAPFHKDYWHPQDYYNYSHEEHWRRIDRRPWIWASYVWTLSEFLVPGYDQGRMRLLHDKGLVSEDREERKDAFYFYKANWSRQPVFHLADKRHRVRLREQTEVTVYSNQGAAELLVNDERHGVQMPDDYGICRWRQVSLRPGENRIHVRTQREGSRFEDSAAWHLVTDIHHDPHLTPVVSPAGSVSTSWQYHTSPQGHEPEAFWMHPGSPGRGWKPMDMPLVSEEGQTGTTWPGKTAHLRSEFTVPEGGLGEPGIYLKQTADESRGNPGKVSVFVDGVRVLVLHVGADGYRFIPIGYRVGELNPGPHVLAVIADRPEKGGFLDIGLMDNRMDVEHQ
jgi:beta-galactosidase